MVLVTVSKLVIWKHFSHSCSTFCWLYFSLHYICSLLWWSFLHFFSLALFMSSRFWGTRRICRSPSSDHWGGESNWELYKNRKILTICTSSSLHLYTLCLIFNMYVFLISEESHFWHKVLIDTGTVFPSRRYYNWKWTALLGSESPEGLQNIQCRSSI